MSIVELLLVAVATMILSGAYLLLGFAMGSRALLWTCLVLLPLRLVLPEDAGALLGFNQLFLVPDLLVPVGLGLVLVRRLAGGTPLRGALRRFPGGLALVVVVLASSYRPGVQLRPFLSDLQKWLDFILAFWFAAEVCRDPRDIWRSMSALLVGVLLATARDLPAYAGLWNLRGWLGYHPNRDAFVVASTEVARYQGSGWPFVINTAISYTLAAILLPDVLDTRTRRAALLGVLTLLLGLLLLSLYRGDWLAMMAAWVVILVALRRISLRFVLTGGALLMVGAVLVAVTPTMIEVVRARIVTLVDPLGQTSVLARLDAFAVAWAMWLTNPLRGVGLGQFGPLFESYSGETIFGVAVDPSYFQQANNDYIHYLATTGLVGACAVFGYLGWWLWKAWRCGAHLAATDVRRPALGILGSMVAFLVNSLSQDPLWDKTYGVLMFAQLGFLSQLARTEFLTSSPDRVTSTT